MHNSRDLTEPPNLERGVAPSHGGSRRRLQSRSVWAAASLLAIGAVFLAALNTVVLPGCEGCHLRGDFERETAASAHASVDCRSCHVPAGFVDRVAFSLGQPLTMFIPLGGHPGRADAAVPDGRCLACHDDLRAAVVTADGVRIAHATCAAGADCTDCHSTTAHGAEARWVRRYDMDTCLACHIGQAQVACDLCHDGRLPDNRIASGSFAITHGPEWQVTHGMGDSATCSVCHKPDDCVECHGQGLPHGADFITVHGAFAVDEASACDGCHEDTFCSSCHGTPMPHTDEFTRAHPVTAGEQADLCARCHAESDCTTCHEKHVHPGGAVGESLPTRGGGQ